MTRQPDNSESAGGGSGTLYVVGTPLGNLDDITLRAIRVLGSVDLIAAEDTRHSRRLLAHLGLHTPLISYHEHNERVRSEELIDRLQAGMNIALITDAGMPGISDPGHVVIASALRAGIPVVPVPGATAATTALVVSGLPTDRYVFEGFLPRSGKERRIRLEKLAREERTIVLYEAPHRLLRTLADLLEALGDRPAAVARELTKVHEETVRGTLSQLLERFNACAPRGEMVITVGAASPKTAAPAAESGPVDDAQLKELLRQACVSGMSRREAARHVAAQTGLPKRAVYQASLEL